MKHITLLFIVALFAPACSSTSSKGKYKEDPSPKFGTSRSFMEPPELVQHAAKAVLEDFTKESNPPSAGSVREEGANVSSGWIYGVSKDKYILYNFNGTPTRKPLSVRRKYVYSVTPSLSGSQVVVKVDEEIEDADLTTGQSKGWKNVSPDAAVYDLLITHLREKIRSL